nr:MAG TPA: hypothetical protein [Bacteriophage sp.]DAU52814.1 MAG TPA: hypothetical protein [Caudoviricetes sp.]
MSKCLDRTTAAKERVITKIKLTAKNKLANIFGANQSMAFAA